jgi:hypothetical protein
MALRTFAEDISASMPPFSRQNIAAGMNEANVLTCQRSNEIHTTITCEKQPYQRAGSKSKGLGLGSMQGIQVFGLFGRDRQMDKLLYRQEIDGFRQNNWIMARVKDFVSHDRPRKRLCLTQRAA